MCRAFKLLFSWGCVPHHSVAVPRVAPAPPPLEGGVGLPVQQRRLARAQPLARVRDQLRDDLLAHGNHVLALPVLDQVEALQRRDDVVGLVRYPGISQTGYN